MTRACIVVAALGLLDGCSNVQCSDGTFRSGKDCVGFDPNDKTPPTTMLSVAGHRSRQPLPAYVTLTTDEPARIYLTTDGTMPDPATAPGQRNAATVVDIVEGTTITYFAIDAAGNREDVKTATYDSDVNPPAPVTDFVVTVDTSGTHVRWTNPSDSDFTGTVLARIDSLVDAGPVQGQAVTAGAALSPSVNIVALGTGTSFDDPGRPPGPVRYVAWTFDDLQNFSPPAAATGLVPLGSLTARLTYNGSLQITTAPANLDLAGSTATLAGTTLTVSLNVKNNTVQYFQNPKAEITATANGTVSNASGTADGHPFLGLGPILVPGTTAAATLVLSNVAAGSTTIDLVFAQHASMVSTFGQINQLGLIDLGSGAQATPLETTALGPNDRMGGRVRPALLVGGHFLDIPTTHGVVERFDLVTGLRVGSVLIGDGERTNVQSLVATGAGQIAVVKQAGRRRSGVVELVQLDEGLHVVKRLPLSLTHDQGFVRTDLSPDGRTLVVPITTGLLLVDALSMTPIDSDPSTPELDPIAVPLSSAPRAAVFFGTRDLVAIAKNTGQAVILHDTPGGYVATIYRDAPNTKGYSVARAADGRVWLAFDTGLRVFDPATSAVTPVAYGNQPHGISNVDGLLWVIRADRLNVDQITNTGTIARTLSRPDTGNSSTNGFYGHWLTALH